MIRFHERFRSVLIIVVSIVTAMASKFFRGVIEARGKHILFSYQDQTQTHLLKLCHYSKAALLFFFFFAKALSGSTK